MITDMIKELFERKVGPVMIGTEVCLEFKKTHKNCVGCKYEPKCEKLVRLQLLILDQAILESQGHPELTDKELDEKINEILK